MRQAFVLTMALALASPVVQAADSGAKSAPALIKEGGRLYQAGKYRESADVLKKANEIAPHPRLIFNIAVALENAGDLKEALSYYQQYVSNTEDTDPTLLKRGMRSIEKLRTLLEKEQQAQAKADADKKRLEEEAEASRKKAEAEQQTARRAEELAQQQQRADYERRMASYKHTKIAAFAFGGAAVASVGVGVLFGLQAKDSRAQFDAATTLADKQTFSDATKSKALLADIGFGVGLASAITAIILYPKEGPPAEGEVRLTLAPRGAGAGVEVGF